MERKGILDRARQLYNEGKWQEAIQLIDKNASTFVTGEDIAEAGRLKGWSYYYLGIKGPQETKETNLLFAKREFEMALEKAEIDKTKISILNGLPLVIWILGKKEEAWQISNKATEEYPNEPTVWNTRGILCRWAQDYKEAVGVGEKVYETALQKKDYRTAGHGKHNKADALVKLGRVEEARKEYEKAIELYKKHEEVTTESAVVHIEGVRKKIADL